MSENEEKVVSVVENSQIDSDYQENKEVKTSSKGTSSNPIWVTILCVLLSVLFTFFATFGVLSDSFKTQLNYYFADLFLQYIVKNFLFDKKIELYFDLVSYYHFYYFFLLFFQ
ncbi:MAG: hypothetical protein MJ236_04340, partial [Clostridia bacterium]|nr:hypothetical protein [Clostridia bacterium]